MTTGAVLPTGIKPHGCGRLGSDLPWDVEELQYKRNENCKPNSRHAVIDALYLHLMGHQRTSRRHDCGVANARKHDPRISGCVAHDEKKG